MKGAGVLMLAWWLALCERRVAAPASSQLPSSAASIHRQCNRSVRVLAPRKGLPFNPLPEHIACPARHSMLMRPWAALRPGAVASPSWLR